MCIGVFIMTSVVGLGFWSFKLPLIGISIFHLPVIVGRSFVNSALAAILLPTVLCSPELCDDRGSIETLNNHIVS